MTSQATLTFTEARDTLELNSKNPRGGLTPSCSLKAVQNFPAAVFPVGAFNVPGSLSLCVKLRPVATETISGDAHSGWK